MAEPLLKVTRLTVNYTSNVALDAVTLNVDTHEIVGIFGPNGAGKSTLMNAIIGLLKFDSGQVTFANRTINGLPVTERARLGIGYAPEGRRVFSGMTVDENLAVASHASRLIRRRLADEMYTLFPQLADRRRSIAWQLSGGEQQMLSLARALMSEPRLVLVDEPLLGLSQRLSIQVLEKLREIAMRGTGVMLCEQNITYALAQCDRAYNLELGSIVAEGTPRELKNFMLKTNMGCSKPT